MYCDIADNFLSSRGGVVINMSHATKSVARATKSVAHATKSVAHATKSVAHATKSVAHATKSVAHAMKSVAGMCHTKSVAHVPQNQWHFPLSLFFAILKLKLVSKIFSNSCLTDLQIEKSFVHF